MDLFDRSPPYYRGCWPKTYKDEQFNEAIQEISENFTSIYNQAKQAEERGLDQICGMGYRKALEFLIKDFLIAKFPEKAEEIKNNHRIVSIIDRYVSDDRVRFLAERALWLGNDHTHYTKKWEDKEIDDLKRLIKTCLHWISAEKELEYYQDEMKDGRQ